MDIAKIQAYRDLYYWRTANGDCFNCCVFWLLGKADPCNKGSIKKGFPFLYEAYMDWYYTEDEHSFLENIRKVYIDKKEESSYSEEFGFPEILQYIKGAYND